MEGGPCPPCQMNGRKAGGPRDGGRNWTGTHLHRCRRARNCGASPSAGPSLCCGSPGGRNPGKGCWSLHLLCLCQTYQLIPGTQMFHYLLLLHLDPGSPGCVQNYLPLKENEGIVPAGSPVRVCVCPCMCTSVCTRLCTAGTVSSEQ